ncbi:TlpA family protein disulfide reductase [Flavobacterium sp. ZB4P23]|uniref:TlpA family protein disulfide reductase n=1 Tax=unclassified Flavobacterium TaxID=196869 RepID=UPI000F828303|nr:MULTISPECIES: TlpA disulfide reductase family protein [unclassified Flavobacterium]RTY83116.1 TlpA family protein disulfide reductase [Flavobacterium sp. ZB4P23]RTZ08493.1 TlpA family protein disulfide reductase [Flavobacterium sp. GSP6]
MKKHFLTILTLLTFSVHAQKAKYYANPKVILNEKEYLANRNTVLEQMKSFAKDMKVFEEIDLKYQNKDSIVYNYMWHFTQDVKATEKEINIKKALIGKVYPFKNEITIDGKSITLNSLKGKPTLINLWFTNCAPCIEEIPVLNKIMNDNKDRFNFVAITFDNKEKVSKLLLKRKFNFTHIVNSLKLTKKLGFEGYPVNIFLDENGIIKEITGNAPVIENEKGEQTMSEGKEFIAILEKYIEKK